MGNYKDMYAYVARLEEKNKPYLIVKYSLSMSDLDMANNKYEVVSIVGRRLRYASLERREALDIIERWELPMLHSLDSRNKIWGKQEFKELFHKLNMEVN
jgi:hypothetical protein